jgi:DNA-binding phage protein
MAKAKTSPKQKKSLKKMSSLRLKQGSGASLHNPLKSLLNEKLIAQAFWECLKSNDPEGAMEVLSAHLSALNKVHLAEEIDLPRSTVYYALKNKNPTLRTVAKLIHSGV